LGLGVYKVPEGLVNHAQLGEKEKFDCWFDFAASAFTSPEAHLGLDFATGGIMAGMRAAKAKG
jgi:hypothetical protein